MSTTEYIMVMSVSPTTGPVSPDAFVLTMSFGNPTGKTSLMTAETSEVPPVPPAETMPCIALVGS
jgi:hypothetical protein